MRCINFSWKDTPTSRIFYLIQVLLQFLAAIIAIGINASIVPGDSISVGPAVREYLPTALIISHLIYPCSDGCDRRGHFVLYNHHLFRCRHLLPVPEPAVASVDFILAMGPDNFLVGCRRRLRQTVLQCRRDQGQGCRGIYLCQPAPVVNGLHIRYRINVFQKEAGQEARFRFS